MTFHMIEPHCLIGGEWNVSRFPAVFAALGKWLRSRLNLFRRLWSDETPSRDRERDRLSIRSDRLQPQWPACGRGIMGPRCGL